ncbi:hypothetical protein COO91_10890 (plasmid) [Nostoc flagelliforme CCNUN1]|uniref:Uncharacterized protein n=1 Tax=Nostoc flagelliforme CCNUN1 TaxID=2038116 RepID=A0A2K8TAG2_9NOSO|nr:hypothetical protein COO91_10890 [Nostoc flagelliforme CCNUN1]
MITPSVQKLEKLLSPCSQQELPPCSLNDKSLAGHDMT